MAKSNRQRKRDRAVRQAKSARKQAAAERRQLTELAVQKAEQLLEAIYDPATPAEEFVSILGTQYEGEPVLPMLAESLIRTGSSPERLAGLSEAWAAAEAVQAESPSLTYLTFAAGVARVTGDTARARSLLDEALGQAGDPEVRVRLSMHLRTHGRVAEAVELLEGMLREDPGDEFAAEQYGLSIEEAFSRLTGAEPRGEEPPGDCPCGSGDAWPDCCGRRERAALDRFGDRSSLTAFRAAVDAYVGRSAYRQGVSEFVAGWLSGAEAGEWDPAERESFAALVGELALLLAKASPDEEAAPAASDEDDDWATVLTAFTADPDVPGELAAIAHEWNSHVHYGLWQIPKQEPAPGLWCTEIVTGVRRYVAFPAEQIDRFPRWGVLLGAVVPVNGIWRSTGQALRLTPDEADALAENLTVATEVLVSELAGKPAKQAARRMREPVPFGRALPHGVIVHYSDAVAAETARVVGMVTGSQLLGLAVEVHEHRFSSPAMTATVGDPKRWLDEPARALHGQAPRQAAQSEDRVVLEAILRELEYEADVLAAGGKPGIDTAWLRQELDMSDDPYHDAD